MKSIERLAALVLIATLAACTRPEPSAPPPQAEAREARVRSLAKDGSEIRYSVYGRGEPAIVFIHGESAANQRKDWSIANFGADVAAAVQESGSPRVVLVGSSSRISWS